MDIKDKVDLESLDIKKDKINKLREVYPEAISEGKVDFEKLRLTLGDQVETGKERYGMNWPGKANCFKIIQTPSKATLKPAKDESINFDTTENLFIEGDNLEVLKLLQSSYYGKVKMIYIDPPYNTGNDFVYPDNYAESLETYLRYTGQKGKEGLKLSTNPETEGRYHSKWMNMMYVRLFLARNLMKDDGVIFISIDDHEVDNLKKICNEIFGDENFYAQINWTARNKPMNAGSARFKLQLSEEYILVYGKIPMQEHKPFNLEQSGDKKYDLTDDNGEKYRLEEIQQRKNIGVKRSEKMVFDIPGAILKPEYRWTIGIQTAKDLLNSNKLIVRNEKAFRIIYAEEEEGVEFHPLWANFSESCGTSEDGKAELFEILEKNVGFETVKPVALIKKLAFHFTLANDIILDFFAGSGTTAQAVIELNEKDKTNRRFILAQLPEPTAEGSETYSAGYKSIADLCKERIRRVIKRIKEEKDGKLDLDDKKQDLGFRVFKLDESNFKVWEGEKPEDLAKQLELYKNNVRDDSKPEDILYELILKSGFEISCKVEELEIQGKKVYSIEDGQLMICLEKGLTKELMKEIAEKEPARVICLDEGYEGNDQLLTNTVEVLKTKGVEFRTV